MSVKKAGDFHQGVAVVDGGWLMDTQGKKYAKLKPYSFVGDFQDNGLAEVGVRRASHSFLDYISIGWGWGDGWGWGGPYWGVGPGWGPYWGDYGYHHHHHHHGWGGSIGISPGAVMPSSMYRGYVNKQGQEVISPTYSFVSPFYGKLALIRDEGHWGMVDAKGQVVIPAAYDALLPFSEGLAAFQSDKNGGSSTRPTKWWSPTGSTVSRTSSRTGPQQWKRKKAGSSTKPGIRWPLSGPSSGNWGL